MRSTWVALTWVAGFSLLACTATQRDPNAVHLPKQADLNVVVISFDALRADVLGAYGSKLGATPHMDAFAARSTVFEQARSAAQATPTSFASVFTGELPHQVFLGWELSDTQTLAEVFQKNGYRTVGYLNNFQLPAERGFDRGFDEYSDAATDLQGGKPPKGNDDKNLQKALSWLKANGDTRFFSWFHFISPHQPYTQRDLAKKFYDPAYNGVFPEHTGKGNDWMEADASEYPRIRSLYDGEVFYADSIFGAIIDQLEAQGLLENTIVVLTSDHGEEFKDHGEFAHKRVYEEVIALPFILYHPDATPGVRTAVNYSNVDLLPTLSGMLGLEYERPAAGRDLSQEGFPNTPQISLGMTNRKYRAASIVNGRYKLITFCKPFVGEGEVFSDPRFDRPFIHPLEGDEMRFELYDLVEDPHEKNNLCGTHADEISNLFMRLTAQLGKPPCDAITDATKGIAPESKLDDDTVEKLKALGYIQ